MMRRNISVSIIILVVAAFAALGALFVGIVWAGGTPDDPEGGTTPAGLSVARERGREDEMQIDAQAGEVILFKSIASTSFHPREASTTHAYGGAGCTYRTSSSGFLVSDLQLPEGAEIDLVRLYFYDNNVDHDADLYLYSYDGLGGFTQVVGVSSSGVPGRSYADSESFSHIVDNAAESLGLVVGTGSANDSSVQICGVRLRYTIQVPSYQFVPAALKQYMAE